MATEQRLDPMKIPARGRAEGLSNFRLAGNGDLMMGPQKFETPVAVLVNFNLLHRPTARARKQLHEQ